MNISNPKNKESIAKQIEQVDEIELNNIIHAVMHRYSALHTDRELSFLALSTDPKIRNQELEDITRFIRTHYK